jgi:hypothetical protein
MGWSSIKMVTIVLLASIIFGFALGTGNCEDVLHASGTYEPIELEPLSDVLIGRDRIAMPLKRIFLVRADSLYCAVRFTKEEIGKTEGEYFATYESWFQGDGSGEISKSNVEITRGDLWWKLPIGIGRLWLATKKKDEISCGAISLKWLAQTAVYLTPKKVGVGQVVHFAPTPWTSIAEVNVYDSRIVWYPQGYESPEIQTPINQLWK